MLSSLDNTGRKNLAFVVFPLVELKQPAITVRVASEIRHVPGLPTPFMVFK